MRQCSQCGSTDIWRHKGGLKGRASNVYIDVSFFTSIYPITYVCRGCGFIAFHVAEEDRERLDKVLSGGSWERAD